MRDYKCDQKFSYLKLNVEKKALNSCCSASSEQINTKWLEENPGKIFNTDNLQQERKDMLAGKRIKSCEFCWKVEDENLSSRRLLCNSETIQDSNINSKVKNLDLSFSSECNLSCSYCCKYYSSGWREDLLKNGPYKDLDNHGDRYKLNSLDKALKKVSQIKKNNLKIYNLIEKELELMDINALDKVSITGGEPFLYHRLPIILQKLSKVKKIKILSGLGFSKNILLRHIENLKKNKNLLIHISAESLKENFEFNRNGSNWNEFLEKIKILKDNNINISFNMTYSNLNIIDYVKFQTFFSEYERELNFAVDPSFMNCNVLDDDTKQSIIKDIHASKFSNTIESKSILDFIKKPYTEKQKQELSSFLHQFCQRKKTTISFMPDSFKKWIGIF